VANLTNFLDVLLVIFIPWSALNLTDYFLVRHGNYRVEDFFVPGGLYGRFAWRGLTAYLVGLLAEIPFVSQVYYTGPLVRDLGGADISWLVGFAVCGALYLALTRMWPLGTGTAPARPASALP
jgi:NCS1 family nucleobase:cation symporter-1